VEDGGGAGDRVGSVRPTASPVDSLGWAVATAAKSRGYDFWGGRRRGAPARSPIVEASTDRR
jgi:hypothetical protein